MNRKTGDVSVKKRSKGGKGKKVYSSKHVRNMEERLSKRPSNSNETMDKKIHFLILLMSLKLFIYLNSLLRDLSMVL